MLNKNNEQLRENPRGEGMIINNNLMNFDDYKNSAIKTFERSAGYIFNDAGLKNMNELIDEHRHCRQIDIEDCKEDKEELNTFEIAVYGDNNDIHNIALECTRCNCVIIDTETIEADQE